MEKMIGSREPWDVAISCRALRTTAVSAGDGIVARQKFLMPRSTISSRVEGPNGDDASGSWSASSAMIGWNSSPALSGPVRLATTFCARKRTLGESEVSSVMQFLLIWLRSSPADSTGLQERTAFGLNRRVGDR